ncbi:hypothetical protein OAM26_02820 [Porticoccaceae bacterium]|nr:hypothetical protein [Porticoccaceae bacterium]
MAFDQSELARYSAQRLAEAGRLVRLQNTVDARSLGPGLLRAVASELATALRWHLLSALPGSDTLPADTSLAELCDLYVAPPSREENIHHSVAIELHQLAAEDDSWLVDLARAAQSAYQLPETTALARNALEGRLEIVDLSAQRWSQPVDWSACAVQKWYDNCCELFDRHREQAVEC